MDSFGVHIDVPEDEPVKKGIMLIKSGWVMSDRDETVKCRLISRLRGELRGVARCFRSYTYVSEHA
eukprot:5170701-Heterocapsa_arctica.AAC.1